MIWAFLVGVHPHSVLFGSTNSGSFEHLCSTVIVFYLCLILLLSLGHLLTARRTWLLAVPQLGMYIHAECSVRYSVSLYRRYRESVNSQAQHNHWCLKLPPVCHKCPPINIISSADSESWPTCSFPQTNCFPFFIKIYNSKPKDCETQGKKYYVFKNAPLVDSTAHWLLVTSVSPGW